MRNGVLLAGGALAAFVILQAYNDDMSRNETFTVTKNILSSDQHNLEHDIEETRDTQRQERVMKLSDHAKVSEDESKRKFDGLSRELAQATRARSHKLASEKAATSTRDQAHVDNWYEKYKGAQERYEWLKRSLDRTQAQSAHRSIHESAISNKVSQNSQSFIDMRNAYQNLIGISTRSN